MLTGTNFGTVRITPLKYNVNVAGSFAPPAGAAGGRTGGKATAFAAGGIVRATPGGVFAQIGEAGQDEAVIPLTKQNMAMMGGGGGCHSGIGCVRELAHGYG